MFEPKLIKSDIESGQNKQDTDPDSNNSYETLETMRFKKPHEEVSGLVISI